MCKSKCERCGCEHIITRVDIISKNSTYGDFKLTHQCFICDYAIEVIYISAIIGEGFGKGE